MLEEQSKKTKKTKKQIKKKQIQNILKLKK